MLNAWDFKSIIDLCKRFPDEKSCHQYLAGQRWNSGILECPYPSCQGQQAYVFKDGIRYKCKCCKKIYTAKTGTIFESTNLSLLKWYIAMYLIMHKKGISSVQLAKDIGTTQKTAWFLLQRIRKVLGNEEQTQLSGTVEIDESFVGGKSKFKHKKKRPKYNPGRGWHDKIPVYGMLERQVAEINERPHKVIANRTVKKKQILKPSKLKAIVVPNVLMLTLKKATLKNVRPGTDLMGDGFNGYRALELIYNVRCVDHGRGHYVDGDCHTNTLEGAWTQFKNMIRGSYHHMSRKHLQLYVDEFVFRYNYRTLGVAEQIGCMVKNMHCRLKYKELVA